MHVTYIRGDMIESPVSHITILYVQCVAYTYAIAALYTSHQNT